MDMFLKQIYKLLSSLGSVLESMATINILSVNRNCEVFTSISVMFPSHNTFAVNILIFVHLP